MAKKCWCVIECQLRTWILTNIFGFKFGVIRAWRRLPSSACSWSMPQKLYSLCYTFTENYTWGITWQVTIFHTPRKILLMIYRLFRAMQQRKYSHFTSNPLWFTSYVLSLIGEWIDNAVSWRCLMIVQLRQTCFIHLSLKLGSRTIGSGSQRSNQRPQPNM